ncbi:hypothetical protein J1N35_030562 [Gossypium stocksii]|uniref:Uncharacterized protein n=1 Tax=Gossypium stocksii TaxID=47602 RepID=A0A9D3ZUH8_9ROSI|nr:hypothetical protein J1N35_030562 [Gossypium stocksii]
MQTISLQSSAFSQVFYGKRPLFLPFSFCFVVKLRPLLFFLVGFGCWNGGRRGARPPRGLPQFFEAGLLFSNRNFLDLVSVFVEAFVLMVVRFRCLPGPSRSRISTIITVTASDVLLVGYIANVFGCGSFVWFPCLHCGDLDVIFGLHNGMHAVWSIAVTSHFLPKPSRSPP